MFSLKYMFLYYSVMKIYSSFAKFRDEEVYHYANFSNADLKLDNWVYNKFQNHNSIF